MVGVVWVWSGALNLRPRTDFPEVKLWKLWVPTYCCSRPFTRATVSSVCVHVWGCEGGGGLGGCEDIFEGQGANKL